MHYEINVSRNGVHFFATHKRSIGNEFELKRVLSVLVAKFPASEGYEVYAEKIETTGTKIDVEKTLEGV